MLYERGRKPFFFSRTQTKDHFKVNFGIFFCIDVAIYVFQQYDNENSSIKERPAPIKQSLNLNVLKQVGELSCIFKQSSFAIGFIHNLKT